MFCNRKDIYILVIILVMVEKHSLMIKKQFESEADSYDAEIRSVFPQYDDLCNNLVKKIFFRKKNLEILDLGIGTGYVTNKLLVKYPYARITAIDLSKKMLLNAKKRLSKYTSQIKYIEEDMIKYETNQKFDLIMGTLSIHHLTQKQKQKLFIKLYSYLESNGIFIIGDLIKGNTAKETKIINTNFKNHLLKIFGSKLGLSYFKLFKKEDIPESLKNHLRLLEKSKFNAKIIWHRDNLAIIIAKK